MPRSFRGGRCSGKKILSFVRLVDMLPVGLPASSANGAFSILTAALLVSCCSIRSIRDIKHNNNWSRRAFSRKCGVLLQGECDDQLPSMSSDTPCWGLFFVYVRTPPRQIWEISTAHPSAVVAGSRIEPNRADPPKCALEEAQPTLSGRYPTQRAAAARHYYTTPIICWRLAAGVSRCLS